MGRELAAAFPAAREVFDEADEVLGVSLSRLMWDGPERELTLTHNAQPAILVHSIAVHRVIAAHLADVRFAAGHSLGELSAYVAAGTLGLADGLRTVRRRGELMFRSGEERPGTMAAIIGLDDEAVEGICREASVRGEAPATPSGSAAAQAGDEREGPGDVCVPANYNAPGQVVVSGDVPAVERAMECAREAGARRVRRLNVSGAFHSPLMGVAEAGLRDHLSSVELRAPAFPVVANVTGEPVSDPVQARQLLVQQLTRPVRWTACMDTIRQAGVQDFLELGPGTVLSSLLRRIDRAVRARPLGTAEDVQRFLEN